MFGRITWWGEWRCFNRSQSIWIVCWRIVWARPIKFERCWSRSSTCRCLTVETDDVKQHGDASLGTYLPDVGDVTGYVRIHLARPKTFLIRVSMGRVLAFRGNAVKFALTNQCLVDWTSVVCMLVVLLLICASMDAHFQGASLLQLCRRSDVDFRVASQALRCHVRTRQWVTLLLRSSCTLRMQIVGLRIALGIK